MDPRRLKGSGVLFCRRDGRAALSQRDRWNEADGLVGGGRGGGGDPGVTAAVFFFTSFPGNRQRALQ